MVFPKSLVHGLRKLAISQNGGPHRAGFCHTNEGGFGSMSAFMTRPQPWRACLGLRRLAKLLTSRRFQGPTFGLGAGSKVGSRDLFGAQAPACWPYTPPAASPQPEKKPTQTLRQRTRESRRKLSDSDGFRAELGTTCSCEKRASQAQVSFAWTESMRAFVGLLGWGPPLSGGGGGSWDSCLKNWVNSLTTNHMGINSRCPWVVWG